MIAFTIKSALAFDRTKDTLQTIEYKISEYDAIFQEHVTPTMFKLTMLGLEAIAQTVIWFWRASLWTIGFGRTIRNRYNNRATRPTPPQPLLLSSALGEMDREGCLIARLDRSAARQSAILRDAGIKPTSRGLQLAPVPSIDYWSMNDCTVAIEAQSTTEPVSMPLPLLLPAGTKRKSKPKRKTAVGEVE